MSELLRACLLGFSNGQTRHVFNTAVHVLTHLKSVSWTERQPDSDSVLGLPFSSEDQPRRLRRT